MPGISLRDSRASATADALQLLRKTGVPCFVSLLIAVTELEGRLRAAPAAACLCLHVFCVAF